MNRGAALAEGEVLVFVHADTFLPSDALEHIEEAIGAGAVGGGFEVQFADDHPVIRMGSRIASFRTRVTKVALGDQVQFVRADVFDEMRGFQEWPILEDLDFARRLKQQGKVIIPRARVLTSARRYTKRGKVRTTLKNYVIWALFLFGVEPARLVSLYDEVR